jgi:mannose-6-phosphate isomerase-like protein (cupin superfamily)
MTTTRRLPFAVGPGEGLDLPLARLGTVHKVPGTVTKGLIAVVEHTLPARHLAAPLHRHSREDELSIVLDGTLGAMLGGDIVLAPAGSYVLKPRGQWHTFWNADATELRFIELLLPGGFDKYFERLSPLLTAAGTADQEAIQSLADEFGLEFDFDSVPELCERLGLTFG